MIVDHCAKPALSGERFESWRASMTALAAHPKVFCKLSGLLTEGEPDEVSGVDRVAEAVFARFGPERIVWGSDWPVVTLRAKYDEWLSLSRDVCARVAPGCEDGVFQQNAMRFYGLS